MEYYSTIKKEWIKFSGKQMELKSKHIKVTQILRDMVYIYLYVAVSF